MGAYNVITRASMAAGQPEDVSVVLANFDAIAAVLNGGLDNSNINAAAAILRTKLALTGTLVQPGDFAGGSKITTSTWVGGPPGGPSDGDIWIATTAMGITGTRFPFQYNAGSASAFKWEALGGTATIIHANLNTVLNAGTTPGSAYWYLAGITTFTPSRSGDYRIMGEIGLYSNTSPTGGDCIINALVNNVLVGGMGDTQTVQAGANKTLVMPVNYDLAGCTAGQVAGVAAQSPDNTLFKFGLTNLVVMPIRVS